MEDTAYRIIIMAQADQTLHHIVLHVKQSFSNEIAKSVYQDIKDRILLLADNPYMGTIPRHTVLRNKNYRMLIINKNIILYRVFDDEKEVRIYNIFSQRQDYLQLLQGL
ncbi:MAG: type II toxin-antitoxin system RelE/ParE family toxin [Veillonella sp.]|uniref:type II toxin-antitoxin system RelE/ParE family toxin n=1 Tax=Veillonella sp. TaxID=1926307 RepID=UPI0028FF3DCA|nr:type II toxin-antitoxin system RelE/ParE family toxin [Veillonella sp.]MDU1938236.1 type II toxin-antitoxin system RelE/ParE family toxin [Veillonella sp.]